MHFMGQNMAHQPQPVQLTGSITASWMALRPKGCAGSYMADTFLSSLVSQAIISAFTPIDKYSRRKSGAYYTGKDVMT